MTRPPRLRARDVTGVVALAALAALAAGPVLVPAPAAAQNDTTGDAERGGTLFTTTYKCYACHGYDAQTGLRRLKPMRFTEDAFAVFVQNSPLQQMPSYPDVSRSALADIYAYILQIPVDAPAVDDIPLLRSIRDDKLDALSN